MFKKGGKRKRVGQSEKENKRETGELYVWKKEGEKRRYKEN
jgi:hypothetical protein